MDRETSIVAAPGDGRSPKNLGVDTAPCLSELLRGPPTPVIG
jgi:hypothetical protein